MLCTVSAARAPQQQDGAARRAPRWQLPLAPRPRTSSFFNTHCARRYANSRPAKDSVVVHVKNVPQCIVLPHCRLTGSLLSLSAGQHERRPSSRLSRPRPLTRGAPPRLSVLNLASLPPSTVLPLLLQAPASYVTRTRLQTLTICWRPTQPSQPVHVTMPAVANRVDSPNDNGRWGCLRSPGEGFRR